MRVAVADDDKELIGQICDILSGAGIACECYPTGLAVQTALKRTTFDVVLLDWHMPGATGIEVLNWAQEHLESAPAFIMLTSRSEPDDIVLGLESGACDYIIKPENSAVILARVNAAARRSRPKSEDRLIDYGRYQVDNLELDIRLDGGKIGLTAKEFSLAKLFFESLNRPLSRAYLLSEVWGSSDQVETRTLDMHVSRIRSKLNLRPENGFVIQTVFGFGYRMDGFEEA